MSNAYDFTCRQASTSNSSNWFSEALRGRRRVGSKPPSPHAARPLPPVFGWLAGRLACQHR